MLIKTLTLFFCGGVLYYSIEIMWRDHSHVSMFLDGGVCFVLIGLMNEVVPGLPLAVQAVLGASLIVFSELLVGSLVNLRLGLNVWDYSNQPMNYRGQVCLPFFLLWIPLAAFASVVDDTLRFWLFAEPWPPFTLF